VNNSLLYIQRYNEFYDTYTKIWKDYFLEVHYNWDMSYPDDNTAMFHIVFADHRASDKVYKAYNEKAIQILEHGDSEEQIANSTANDAVQYELKEAWKELFEECKNYGQQPTHQYNPIF